MNTHGIYRASAGCESPCSVLWTKEELSVVAPSLVGVQRPARVSNDTHSDDRERQRRWDVASGLECRMLEEGE